MGEIDDKKIDADSKKIDIDAKEIDTDDKKIDDNMDKIDEGILLLEVIKKEACIAGLSNSMLWDLSMKLKDNPSYIEASIGDIDAVVELILSDVDNKMIEHINALEKFYSYSKHKAVEYMINYRLKLIGKDLAAQLVRFFLKPNNYDILFKNLWKSSDLIWKTVENNPVDFSFYSKRMILSMLYTSTILYYIKDSSVEQKKTALFLKKRIENIADLAKVKNKIKNIFGNLHL